MFLPNNQVNRIAMYAAVYKMLISQKRYLKIPYNRILMQRCLNLDKKKKVNLAVVEQ